MWIKTTGTTYTETRRLLAERAGQSVLGFLLVTYVNNGFSEKLFGNIYLEMPLRKHTDMEIE